ncbi:MULTISPECIES: hypothetical protein [Bradyrhizobium]|uniref:hypothetical protein n=1 Tax=Bradyrhizobium TaxID=374 RepID=UPI001143A771|nr:MULTISPECIES: hypothetical protein [Bradyrhizobium]UFW45378.1 hypothetical protein BaraCB756_23915 [Bradyrhizobium arachidis]
MYRLVHMMTPAEYLELAECFAWAADHAWDPISKSQLEASDKSYSVLERAFHPVCTKAFALRMVEGGWLTKNGDRYELTTQGREAPD